MNDLEQEQEEVETTLKGRKKGQANTPIQIRATFTLLYDMRCFSEDEIQKKLMELYGYNLTPQKRFQWIQTKALEAARKRINHAHPDVLCQYLTYYLKDILITKARNLQNVADSKDLDKDIQTLMKGITLLYNLNKGISDSTEIKPDEKEVVEKFLKIFNKKV